MIKVLIVEDNLKYVKNILNYVLNKFDEITIKYIATTVNEAKDILLNNQVDLIFLDLNLPDATGMEIIKKVKLYNSVKPPYIIVISGEVSLINELRSQGEIYSIINKLQDKYQIYELIKQFLSDFKFANSEKKEIITEILIDLIKNLST